LVAAGYSYNDIAKAGVNKLPIATDNNPTYGLYTKKGAPDVLILLGNLSDNKLLARIMPDIVDIDAFSNFVEQLKDKRSGFILISGTNLLGK
jgi:hypothetical protein